MPPGDVTLLLLAWSNGNREALEDLLPVVYRELRRIAAAHFRHERPDHTLQPTGLVHEAYLKLIDQQRARWQNRAQFFGVAAQLMRRILVDHARTRAAAKRGGGGSLVTLVDTAGASLHRGWTSSPSMRRSAPHRAFTRTRVGLWNSGTSVE